MPSAKRAACGMIRDILRVLIGTQTDLLSSMAASDRTVGVSGRSATVPLMSRPATRHPSSPQPGRWASRRGSASTRDTGQFSSSRKPTTISYQAEGHGEARHIRMTTTLIQSSLAGKVCSRPCVKPRGATDMWSSSARTSARSFSPR